MESIAGECPTIITSDVSGCQVDLYGYLFRSYRQLHHRRTIGHAKGFYQESSLFSG